MADSMMIFMGACALLREGVGVAPPTFDGRASEKKRKSYHIDPLPRSHAPLRSGVPKADQASDPPRLPAGHPLADLVLWPDIGAHHHRGCLAFGRIWILGADA